MNILRRSLSLSLLLLGSLSLTAHEGMWIPTLLAKLNESEMKTMGMRLSAEDIYSINKSSLKDAIVQFNGGCTAEVISKEGLILTNHHCGYGQIQQHSSLQNDYLKNGFWAYNRSEELKNPGVTATFIVYIENVTEQILDGVQEAGANKNQVIARNISKTVEEATKNKKYEAVIKPFYYGNEYYMIVTKTYKDVRLVGAPPSAIGKFGGDTDNWVWPRHTGDFSLFRIYAGADNQPADISDKNVPYKPGHSLPISIKGVQEGDFAMIYGFPGRTQQYLHSYALEYTLTYGNPAKIAMRTASLKVIDAVMLKSDKTRIQYAAKQSRIANAWKKWQGESRGLEILGAVDTKQKFEEEFTARARKNNKKDYIDLDEQFTMMYANNTQLQLANDYFTELVAFGPEILRFTNRFDKLLSQYEGLTTEEQKKMATALLPGVTAYFKDYDLNVDREIFRSLIKLYIRGLEDRYLAPTLVLLKSRGEAEIDEYVDKVYSRSAFARQLMIETVLKNPSATGFAKLKKDPIYMLMKELYDKYASISPDYNAFTKDVDAGMELYVKGMMDLFPEKRFWPDANSTIRVSYGKVEGSDPKDGMRYKYYTTLDGIMEKYVPGNSDFEVPEKLRELYTTKNYGPYATNGSVPVAFTASLHTTGGNSG
ncbi:MAG: S46 family peptidase, partial [Bacteroidota bacterium]